jgi:hypothetical protein
MPVKPEFSHVYPRDGKIQDALLIHIRENKRDYVHPTDAYEALANYFGLSSKLRRLTRAEYYPNDLRPGRAWDNLVQWAVRGLRKDRYLLPASAGRGAWRLSADGARHADALIALHDAQRPTGT